MKRTTISLGLVLLAAGSAAFGQSSSLSSNLIDPEANSDGGGSLMTQPAGRGSGGLSTPFSHVAFGAGVSPLGVGLQLSTNISRHFNLRGNGNFFDYSTNFTTSGITANAKLNYATAGAALDFYPFHFPLRVSPGVLLRNDNQLSAVVNVPAGTSFTLNSQTYYSASANASTGATPVNGTGVLGLNTTKPALTLTTGWGNTIPRNGGHWSFPFEVGVAFIGAPTVKVNLAGTACYDQAQAMCTDLSSTTDPIAIDIQNNLHAQVAKWTSDLQPLRTYPIASIGVAYSFRIRGGGYAR